LKENFIRSRLDEFPEIICQMQMRVEQHIQPQNRLRKPVVNINKTFPMLRT
jgi:hypothetical protein